ncbi:MAG: sigma-70 family RNA polymerase sigma factor [Myxococcales bacterium]|nr:sigma-70 family RNA polymerase sigma factor [Myxococcales bacterium]
MSDFESHRQFLIGVAYRMLGSVAEAEDAVQDAYLRWQAADRSAVDEPRAYLARVVTRLCLDRLKSARARREQYVGTWLPEPMIEEAGSEVADDLSVALLMTLERLSPLERAAFLLHDVFDMDYSAIAGVLERSEPAVRQLAARARDHVRDARPRFERTREAEAKLTAAFAGAMLSGDTTALSKLLAEDAVFYSDGGGKKKAALNPIYGRDKIVRFFVGIQSKRDPVTPETARPVRINGLPGFVLTTREGLETIAIETSGDHIVAIYAVRNPDKLAHLH